MPGFDGTGPMGMGSMTGGGRGYCATPVNSSGQPVRRPAGFYGRGYGARGGFGRGGGRGRRNWYYATGLPGWQRASMGLPAFGGGVNPAGYPYGPEISPQQEAAILKGQADVLRKQLEEIQGRIEALGKIQAEEEKK